MADSKIIGNDNIESSLMVLRNYFVLGKFPALSSGKLNSILIYFSGNTNATAAVYSDASDSPNALLAQAGEVACVAGFNQLNLISSIDIVKDAYYWLAFNYGSSVNYARGNTGTGIVRAKVATYSTFTFPDPAGSGFTPGDRIISIYGIGSMGCPRQAMHMRRLM